MFAYLRRFTGRLPWQHARTVEMTMTNRLRSAGQEQFTVDSFECAIHALAPTCAHCGTRIMGHGLEAEGGIFFCCAHCARDEGQEKLKDRA